MLNNHFNINSKYILLLSMLYVTISITATVTAYKFVNFGIANVSGATIIFPINSFLCILITEIYGYEIVKKVIWSGLCCELIFSLLSIAVINLPSPSFWNLQTDYNTVLGPSLRFVISGIAADLVGMFGGAYLISKWKLIMRGKNFWLRCVASAIISDFFMTIIIGVCAFTGKVSLNNLLVILFSGYLLHVLYAIVLIWPTIICTVLLKKIENIDVFDININYNPFKFNNIKGKNLYALNTATPKIS